MNFLLLVLNNTTDANTIPTNCMKLTKRKYNKLSLAIIKFSLKGITFPDCQSS